ncbi:MAG: VOC family protein [Rhodospirillaceae bacterium]|nr:VOC family protein [Rhodospirillaceae bacterium]MYK58791.1 VOC family protein [Rhodospirillaceae bacterium]
MAENPIPIKGLDHIVLRVRDIDVMLRYYGDVLGCTLEKVQEDIGLWQMRAGDALIDFAPVDGQIGRQKGPAPGPEGHNQDHFCLLVDPWDEAAIRSALEVRGCDVEAAAVRYGATGYGPSIYLTDPEGNTVELKGPST